MNKKILLKWIARFSLVTLLLAIGGVRAQPVMYQKIKQVIEAEERSMKLASSAMIVLNLFNDVAAIEGSTIIELRKAIEVRKSCLDALRMGLPMPTYGGVNCPTEPRTLLLLNAQLVRAMQMQRLGSIRLARDVLCLSSQAVKAGTLPAGLLPTLAPHEKEAWNFLQRGFKDAYGTYSQSAKDAISQKCDLSRQRTADDQDELKSALGSDALTAWVFDAVSEVANSCGQEGTMLNSDKDKNIRDALAYCHSIDRDNGGASTEDQAQSAIDRIKAQLLADEQLASAPTPPITYSNSPSTIWNGEYICNQGLTQLQLRSYNATVEGASPLFIFQFGPDPSNPSVPNGAFTMLATLTWQPGGNFNASPLKWINQPEGYFMVGLNGRFSSDLTQISGKVEGENCTGFRLQRVRQ
jgi:hypothetical protein